MHRLLFSACLGMCLVASTERITMADAPPLWKVVGAQGNKFWEAVRINTATGQCWSENNGNWSPFSESGTAPIAGDPGTYDCLLFFPAESDSFFATRWNTRTGQSWSLGGGKWVDMVTNDK